MQNWLKKKPAEQFYSFQKQLEEYAKLRWLPLVSTKYKASLDGDFVALETHKDTIALSVWKKDDETNLIISAPDIPYNFRYEKRWYGMVLSAQYPEEKRDQVDCFVFEMRSTAPEGDYGCLHQKGNLKDISREYRMDLSSSYPPMMDFSVHVVHKDGRVGKRCWIRRVYNDLHLLKKDVTNE